MLRCGKDFRQFPEVLGGGGEEEFVARAAWTAQSETSETEDAFEVGEEHLDLLPELHGYVVLLGFGDIAGDLASVLVLLAGGWMVIRGDISLGLWVQFNSYLWMLITPMRMLGEVVNQIALADSSAERLAEILETQPHIANPANPQARPTETKAAFLMASMANSHLDRGILADCLGMRKPMPDRGLYPAILPPPLLPAR